MELIHFNSTACDSKATNFEKQAKKTGLGMHNETGCSKAHEEHSSKVFLQTGPGGDKKPI